MMLRYYDYKEEARAPLHCNFNHKVEETFYRFKSRFDTKADYDKYDEFCIYLGYATECLAENYNIDFMKEKLVELLSDEDNIEFVKNHMLNEFLEDLKKLDSIEL